MNRTFVRVVDSLLAAYVLFAGVLLLANGCHDGCEPDTMRCNGDRVEVCNTETDWELSADCSDIEDMGESQTWVCCVDPDDGMHACLPDWVCEPDAGDGGS